MTDTPTPEPLVPSQRAKLLKLIGNAEKHAGDCINETAYALSFDGPSTRRADQARARANKAEQAMLTTFAEIRDILAGEVR